jgi:hypothetical protein
VPLPLPLPLPLPVALSALVARIAVASLAGSVYTHARTHRQHTRTTHAHPRAEPCRVAISRALLSTCVHVCVCAYVSYSLTHAHTHSLCSDLLVQIVDARNPLLFRCTDLEAYVAEVDPAKRNLLLINKADLLTDAQRCAAQVGVVCVLMLYVGMCVHVCTRVYR